MTFVKRSAAAVAAFLELSSTKKVKVATTTFSITFDVVFSLQLNTLDIINQGYHKLFAIHIQSDNFWFISLYHKMNLILLLTFILNKFEACKL